ncbi:MAG: carboxypeptidase-like regulatory domain-containing protein [bacterium]|nr:carboxypeptidase-like regulatory domain-containing protein [bacterium]
MGKYTFSFNITVGSIRLFVPIVIILLVTSFFSATLIAQEKDLSEVKITLNLKNEPLSEVLKKIIEKTDLSIIFSDEIVESIYITKKFKNTDLITVLDSILKENDLFYTINPSRQITVHNQRYPGLRYTILTGKVTDESGIPLEFANVYLANTFIGASTDKDGLYSINNVPVGTNTVIVSMMGYEVVQKKIRHMEPVHQNLSFQLKEKVEVLSEVVVVAESPERRQRNYDRFVKAFIGESDNAGDTEILNPDILDFSYNEANSTLTAKADNILLIKNNSLGYIVNYSLIDFIHTDKKTIYRGYPRFEKLESENKKQEKKWRENRQKTYKGSLRNFLTSLINKKTRKNGFKVQQAELAQFEALDMLQKQKEQQEASTTNKELRKAVYKQAMDTYNNRYKLLSISIKQGELGSEKVIRFDNYLRVQYRRKENVSYIGLVGGSTTIDKNGWLYEPFSVAISGKWSEYRVADLLPYEYDPEEK